MTDTGRLFASPTQDEWLFLGIILFLVIMLITAAELVRRLMYGNSEITRKFVHVVVGLLMVFAPWVFHSGVPALLISSTAIVGTITALRLNLLQSIHDTARSSYGTVFHPLSFLLLVLAFWNDHPAILSISILMLAVPDALAAVAGRRARSPHFFAFSTDKKTMEGSIVMFLSSAVLIYGFLVYHSFDAPYPWIVIAIVTAAIVTLWELVCTHGLDNLSVPLSTAFLLHYFLVPEPHHDPAQLMMALLLAGVIGLVSLRFHFLSPSGSLATFLLAVIVYGIGGWKWTVPILTFFIASSLLSKTGKARKKRLEQIFDKTDKRDAGQVAANGGVPGAIIVLWYISPEWTWLYPVYLASIAAVTADTWGTEIGTLFKGTPRSIITLKKVPVGTSGGVSMFGLLGGAAGALLVVLSALPFAAAELTPMVIAAAVASGVAGALADSVMGASVQAQYRTPQGTLTERTIIDGQPTVLVRGFRWVDNDIVNWSCAIVGALTMYLLLSPAKNGTFLL